MRGEVGGSEREKYGRGGKVKWFLDGMGGGGGSRVRGGGVGQKWGEVLKRGEKRWPR